MIIFDKYGNPQPPGSASIAIDLFKKEFVDNCPTYITSTDLKEQYKV